MSSADAVCESYLAADVTDSNSLYYIVKKLFLRSQDEQVLNHARILLESEIETLQELAQTQEQIQELFTYWEENRDFYVVQEYIPGNPLSLEIGKGKIIQEKTVISLVSEILKILEFIHHHGVIHQNLKLTNIIQSHPDGQLVLVDFGGIRKAIHNIGRSEYMPIEQLHGKTRFNSDIYALGIIAIAALTGQSAKEIAGINSPKHFLTGEIIWQHYNRKVSGNLAKIINRMVRLDYRHRYQSASEVLKDIQSSQNKSFFWIFQRPEKVHIILLAGIISFILVGIFSWFLVAPRNVDHAKIIYEQGADKYQKQNYQGAIESFTQAIKINPDYAQAYNERGDAFYRLGNYEKSQSDSSEAIRLNPQDANAYYDRGFTLYTLNNYNGAIADFSQAITINSKNADAYYARGLARSQIKEKQNAIEDFNQAIAINSDYAAAYLERAKIFRKQGKKLEAIKDFDEAIALKPENPEYYYERGLANFQLNQRQSAKKDFSKTIELDSKHIKAYLMRGDIYTESGDTQKAYTDYNQAFLLDDKFPETYIHWGKFRLRNNDIEGAIKDFQKAIQLEPKEPSAYNSRGNAYLAKGLYKDAVNDYTKAIELESNYALAYYNRGLVRIDLGKIADAIEDFEKAAQFFQDKGEEASYNDAMVQSTRLMTNAKLKSLRP
jgi:tetratricopeptide (TPR) repeat protein/tRNA A-37 threonylcarbamoyl transferase component Bud32